MKKCKVIFVALLACAFGASARTVTSDEAQSAARAWVHRGKTLGARFPSDVATATTAYATTNDAVFYAVKMANGGTVFMSGDTTAEPVICFTSDTGDFSTIATNSPLWALLNADVSTRCKAARPKLVLATMAAAAQQTAQNANEQKWATLVDEGEALAAMPRTFRTAGSGVVAVGDVRVEALVKSKWNQADVSGQACYNYYTPQGWNKVVPGDSGNAVCGCVATAMAQLMRYWEYPKTAVAQVTRTCSWNGADMDLTTQGGTYDWEKMTLIPGVGEPEENRQAIGKLTSDAGISVEMGYTDTISGSGALGSLSYTALKEVFGYKNAEFNGSNYAIDIDKAAYPQTLFSNFDAKCPVLMFIYGNAAGGHAIVGDGYGYNEDQPYVHLNMGWSGLCDLWYNVPDIDTDSYQFTIMIGVAYNVFPETAGNILSGRIVDDDGVPIEGAKVEVLQAGTMTVVTNVTTGAHGIYAFILPAGTYDVSATSADGKLKSDLSDIELDGVNSWGNDMVLAEPTVRIGTKLFASLDKALAAAQNGDEVEILLPTILKRTVTLMADCTVFATNANAAASAVTRRDNAMITIADGRTVTMTNVAFDVGNIQKTVEVCAGGALRIGGGSGLVAVETALSDGLVVVSELTCPIYVDCTSAVGTGTSFAVGTLDYATAANCANLLLHYSDTRLGGKAVDGGGSVLFQWARGVPVPKSAADGRLNGENYRSINDIFEDFRGDTNTEIVIFRDVTFTNCVVLATNLVMRGEGEPRPVLTAADTSGFRMLDNGSLTVTNLVFSGYDTVNKAGGFISVEGGALTLGDGAVLSNMTGRVSYRSGVIDLLKGKVTMLPGAVITDCKAYGLNDGKGCGGAIFANSATDCLLDLRGGTITNCHATCAGGGVYVDENNSVAATVRMSGRLRIAGNRSPDNAQDDFCVYTIRALPYVQVASNLFGWVGVRYDTPVRKENKKGSPFISINAEGDAFATNVAGPLDNATLLSFFNDTDDTLCATTNAANELVWAKKDEDGQCAPANAKALLIDADGRTNYYASVARAFEYMGDNSPYCIEMQDADSLTAAITVPVGRDVTLRLAPGLAAEDFPLTRDGDFGFIVPTGASLCLTNVCISGEGDFGKGRAEPFFLVSGGEMELDGGAVVRDVEGTGKRDANAITVTGGGTFIMRDGALIANCTNSYANSEKPSDYGVGGGLLVGEDASAGGKTTTAYLLGGTITNCHAQCGGAVYVCDRAEIYVSGAMRVEKGKANSSNDFVVEDSAALYLNGKATGYFNMVEGTNGTMHDPEFIGKVIGDWRTNFVALTNSAARFVNRDTGYCGTVATNIVDKDDFALVWCGAVSDGALYTNLEGKVYAPVADVSGLIPAPPAFMPLPELGDAPSADDVASALETSQLADDKVAARINGSADPVAAYNDFRGWATAVGVEDVVSSEHAYDSYKLGMTSLLENDPMVEITEAESVDGGLQISVVVKDGEDPVEVASAKVAELFEATSDVSDWTKEIDLTVTDLTQSTADEVRFTIKPVAETPTAFIRLKY